MSDAEPKHTVSRQPIWKVWQWRRTNDWLGKVRNWAPGWGTACVIVWLFDVLAPKTLADVIDSLGNQVGNVAKALLWLPVVAAWGGLGFLALVLGIGVVVLVVKSLLWLLRFFWNSFTIRY